MFEGMYCRTAKSPSPGSAAAADAVFDAVADDDEEVAMAVEEEQAAWFEGDTREAFFDALGVALATAVEVEAGVAAGGGVRCGCCKFTKAASPHDLLSRTASKQRVLDRRQCIA